MKKLFINTEFLDIRACAKFGLTSEILMENAAAAMANFVRAKFKKRVRILGVVGGGNNGADVLATLRMLSGDYDAVALLASQNLKPLCKKQLDRALLAGVKAANLQNGAVQIEQGVSQNLEIWLENLRAKCVIDGLFGSGLSRDLSANHVNLILNLNAMSAYKLACDVPSGLDLRGNVRGACFRADTTITMGARKLGLYSDFAKDFTGRVKCAKLGLSSRNFNGDAKQESELNLIQTSSFCAFANGLQKFNSGVKRLNSAPQNGNLSQEGGLNLLAVQEAGLNFTSPSQDDLCAAATNAEQIYENFLLTKRDLNLPFRTKKNTNKGDFGHVFIVSGKLSGAAQIAGLAALATGAGLVSVVSERELNLSLVLMQSAKITDKMAYGAVGMGLGELEASEKSKLFEILAAKNGLVIDADLCYEPCTIELLKTHENTVVTPHPKEFASLLNLANLGKFSVEQIQQNRFELARKFSLNFSCTLVLKGANTIIAHAGKIYVMPYGSAALAKGGSGDALSGIIAALLAQGYGARDAAISGTLAHALAARKFRGANYALDALDIIKGLKWLRKK